MSKFEKRRAHIEMLSPKTCRITTALTQKVFDLSKLSEHGIDLIYLNKKTLVSMIDYGPSRFYAYVRRKDYDSGMEKYRIEVYACIAPNNYIKVPSDSDPNIFDVEPGKAETFSVTLYTG